MKRQAPESSDQYNNTAKQSAKDHNPTNGNETSEHQSVPSTTVQSFPAYSYDTSEYYNNQMNPNQMMQNQMMMYNTMRNYPWPVSMVNNMPMNSTNLSYGRSMEPMNNSSTNSCEYQPQTESNNSEMVRPQSPLVVPYSDEEASLLMEKLRNKDTFQSALQTLTTWLLKSEFNKNNTTLLFQLIQFAQANVWKLMNDKASYKNDLNQVKLQMTQKKKGILSQFQEICKVFDVAKLQKVWDHFTKPQRKQIGTWIEETNEIMSTLEKELAAENMDLDEDSEQFTCISDLQQVISNEEYQEAQEKLDSIQNQISAAVADNIDRRDEMKRIKSEQEEKMRSIQKKIDDADKEIKSIRSFLSEVKSPNNTSNKRNTPEPITNKESKPKIDKEDIRLISLIGTFLIIHPDGASLEYICSYLNNLDPKSPSVDCRCVENLLSRFPKMFKAETKGVGADLTKVWIFLGFEKVPKNN